MKDKLIDDLEGNILEHTVLINLLEKYKNLLVTQFRYNDKEVNMLIKNKDNIDLYEIKRNKNIVDKQYEWLINSDFCKLIEDSFEGKIRNRYVLYLGEGKDVTSGSYTIKYRNVSDFLKAL